VPSDESIVISCSSRLFDSFLFYHMRVGSCAILYVWSYILIVCYIYIYIYTYDIVYIISYTLHVLYHILDVMYHVS